MKNVGCIYLISYVVTTIKLLNRYIITTIFTDCTQRRRGLVGEFKAVGTSGQLNPVKVWAPVCAFILGSLNHAHVGYLYAQKPRPTVGSIFLHGWRHWCTVVRDSWLIKSWCNVHVIAVMVLYTAEKQWRHVPVNPTVTDNIFCVTLCILS